jgi:hypothetical protein
VEHRTRLHLEAGPAKVGPVLADLSTYPEWNDLVATAVPDDLADQDTGPVWSITLRARVGPFARSKQLRMVRVHLDDESVRFERRERDGRTHASWVMEAEVTPAGSVGTTVELILRYDGGLWTSALDGILRAAIERAATRLPSYLDQR